MKTLENLVAAASADAVLLTLAPAEPEAVPDVPAAGVPLRAVITDEKLELPRALTFALLPIPRTVTWLFALSDAGLLVWLALFETKEPEITPFAASRAAEEEE